MKLEKRELTMNGRRDTYSIPGSEKKLVLERNGCYICDENGKRVSKVYDKIHEFKNGVAIFDKGKLKGAVNDRGEELFKTLFENARLDGEVIRICVKGKWGFASLQGKTLCKPQFFFLEKFVNGYARFATFDNKWGIVDIRGKIVVPAKYDFLGSLEVPHIVAKNPRGFGVIDIKDHVVVPFKYNKIGFEGTRTSIYNSEKDKIVV